MNEIIETLRKCLLSVRGNIDDEKVSSEANFFDDLGLDDSGVSIFIGKVENTYNVFIPTKYSDEFATMRDVAKYLHKNRF